MKRNFLAAGLAAFLACTVSTANAAPTMSCDDIVVDNLKIISDLSKVAAAAKQVGQLTGVAADVRIRTTRSFQEVGAKNLDQYMGWMLDQCPSWQAGDAKKSMKSTMIVVVMHTADWVDPAHKIPKAFDAGMYYGVQNATKLKPAWPKLEKDALVPALTAYQNGEKDAYTRAFVSMMTATGLVLKPPLAAPTTGPVTVVNQAPSDNSWFGRMVIWVLVLLGIAGGLAYYLYARSGASDLTGVQADTRRIRSGCLERVLAISDQAKIDELDTHFMAVKPSLSADELKTAERDLATFKKASAAALAAFNRFDNVKNGDPNEGRLSADAYHANQLRYEEIIAQHVEPAEQALENIGNLLSKAIDQARTAA